MKKIKLSDADAALDIEKDEETIRLAIQLLNLQHQVSNLQRGTLLKLCDADATIQFLRYR